MVLSDNPRSLPYCTAFFAAVDKISTNIAHCTVSFMFESPTVVNFNPIVCDQRRLIYRLQLTFCVVAGSCC